MKTLQLFITALCLLGMAVGASAKTTVVNSPDGRLSVTAQADNNRLCWSIQREGVNVMLPSDINITLDGRQAISGTPKVNAQKTVNTSFATPFYKKTRVDDHYRTVTLQYSRVSVEFRVYNDAAAYRLVYNGKKACRVDNEQAAFCFQGDPQAFIPFVDDNRSDERYCYSFESYYDEQPLSHIKPGVLAIAPLAVCLPNGLKAIVMDAGVENYPGMFITRSADSNDGTQTLLGEFSTLPLEQHSGGYANINLMPTRRANYIASLNGRQALPWRAVVVTTRDADIINCDIAQQLAPACRIADTSWIKPGKVAWDWWNNTNITGVDFQSGMNTPTYLYYIDFAAKNNLEYIIIDEGWSGKESLLENLNPDIDLKAITDYAQKKGVGVILWSSWRNMIGNQPDGGIAVTERVMSHYANMGIKGFKVDFFDRDDQQAVRSAAQIAQCAASHQLLVDYHGLKPGGLQRAWPNIVNFEGVKGLENSKWEPRTAKGPLHNQPRYDVTIPYLRMLIGPMDYTPGAMDNAMPDHFFGNNNHPMSQGTRVHQMAMYATYEAPLQMLADSPSKYMREQECTDFIAAVPTTFDQTVAIDGQMGEYTVVARRKGATWYVAAMTDWTPRTLTIPLSFLGEGNFQADIFADGANASKEATDYVHLQQPVNATTQLTARLSSGGGWTAIITKK